VLPHTISLQKRVQMLIVEWLIVGQPRIGLHDFKLFFAYVSIARMTARFHLTVFEIDIRSRPML
jgi:hypothetical protein